MNFYVVHTFLWLLYPNLGIQCRQHCFLTFKPSNITWNSYFRYKWEKVILSSWWTFAPERSEFFDTSCGKLNLVHAFLLERVCIKSLSHLCIEHIFFVYDVYKAWFSSCVLIQACAKWTLCARSVKKVIAHHDEDLSYCWKWSLDDHIIYDIIKCKIIVSICFWGCRMPIWGQAQLINQLSVSKSQKIWLVRKFWLTPQIKSEWMYVYPTLDRYGHYFSLKIGAKV